MAIIIFIFLAANEVFGQITPKGFTYVLRNEKGDIMNSSELKRIVVKSVNEYEAVMTEKYDDGKVFSYCYGAKYPAVEDRRHTVMCLHSAGTGMSPPAPGIDVYHSLTSLETALDYRELTLAYKGKQMKLLFDEMKRNHLIYNLIDSLPFQAGTFRLRSFECEHGEPPPGLITEDTRNRVCFISADNWVKKD